MRIVVAPDKFKGTCTARELTDALTAEIERAGHTAIAVPLADGGDGTVEALGGPNRTTTVTGPLGGTVEAPWRLSNGTAVIEMAAASGLVAAGGSETNDPIAATTRGTGELVVAAVARGAKRIIVGLGGSATTDGGLGAVEAIGSPAKLAGVDVIVATDVATKFVDAARVFGPQKGASPAQVAFLEARLRGVAERYRDDFGADIESTPGSGAAGGLGGGLLALGAKIVAGFGLIADELRLYEAIETADLVITGEGQLDRESFNGKVVGGVCDYAIDADTRLVVIAGGVAKDHDPDLLPADSTLISLSAEFGIRRAMQDPTGCAAQALRTWLEAESAT